MKRWLVGALAIFAAALCGACTSATGKEGKTKIVFELEGGTYRNCVLPIVCYYDFEENTQNLILEPTALSKIEITRAGYRIEGWYQTKTQEGENFVYSDKWDFSTDKVTSDGVTLYAKWEKEIRYSYNVCYRDDKGEAQVLGSYEVNEGEAFEDYLSYATKRYGYTALGYRTEQGEVWDKTFTHPGGEESLAVNVFVEYIEGTYAIVETAAQLKANKTKNIYLIADIDFDGADFGFGDYRGTLLGNGHKISNFKLQYDATKNALTTDFDDENKKSLCIGLFGNANGAVIENVRFENVTVDVATGLSITHRIYVAPLGVDVKNTRISNVTFEGTFGYSKLPDGFDAEENLKFVTDGAYYRKDDGTTVENFTADIDIVGEITEKQE
ncbi:MAG: hypothetical protein IJX91_04705 [Clostridia bacterium]|nr:hypothetical protein [Clostridia bacterium]